MHLPIKEFFSLLKNVVKTLKNLLRQRFKKDL